MKTYTITLHNSQNCGSSLQSFALQKFLLKNSIDNEIIDYQPKYKASFSVWIKKTIKQVLFFRSVGLQKKKFLHFTMHHLQLTKKTFHSFDELKKENFVCDAIITGSDQLWNMMYDCGRDDSFYLSFCNLPKYAYSVSLGRSDIPYENLDKIHRLCSDFQWISVREQRTVDLVSKYVSCPVEFVCDPTLLLSSSDYESISSPRVVKNSYIFIYLAQEVDTNILKQIVDKVKYRHIKAKIVFSGTFKKRCKCDVHIKDISPSEFISCIMNADYVICNSFHACVFSMIFKKPFTAILPPLNGERIESLLKVLNAPTISSGNIREVNPSIEEYAEISKSISRFADYSSTKFLKEILKR